MVRTNRKSEVLLGKAAVDSVAKTKALRPNAARGNAVAVPRWLGQFKAANKISAHDLDGNLDLTCLN